LGEWVVFRLSVAARAVARVAEEAASETLALLDWVAEAHQDRAQWQRSEIGAVDMRPALTLVHLAVLLFPGQVKRSGFRRGNWFHSKSFNTEQAMQEIQIP
jgi:hypothetical protein